MQIKRLVLKNFKRFTDLVINNIPDDAKLVLLIGSNGSGKSSVFDAFELLNTLGKSEGISNWEYYRKDKSREIEIDLSTDDGNTWTTNERDTKLFTNAGRPFYGRTSFRQMPRLSRTSLGSANVDFFGDTDRPRFFIEKDNRFENDIEKITETILNYRSLPMKTYCTQLPQRQNISRAELSKTDWFRSRIQQILA